MDPEQNVLVLSEARQKLVRRAARTELVLLGQRAAVLLHLFDTEQFRTQRRRIAILARVAVPVEMQMQQVLDDSLTAFFEFEVPFV